MTNNYSNLMKSVDYFINVEFDPRELLKISYKLHRELGFECKVTSTQEGKIGHYLASGYNFDPKINVIHLFTQKHELKDKKCLEIVGRFENKYDIEKYRLVIICPFGFTKGCIKMMDHGVLIKGKEFFLDLIEQKYGETGLVVDLMPHNEKTFYEILNTLKTKKRVCAIQATGTGKRFLAAKLMNHYVGKNIYYLSPSNYINNQQIKLIKHLTKKNKNQHGKCKVITYQSLLYRTDEQLSDFNADLFILDEFHRCGADKWGERVEKLFRLNPRADVIGTTATHIRYTDSCKNMAELIFDSSIATYLPLELSIAKGITPCPKFVAAYYQHDLLLNAHMKSLINDLPRDQRELAIKEFQAATINFSTANNIENILLKHLESVHGKYMVFCESIPHAEESRAVVEHWFSNMLKKRGEEGEIHTYISHSKMRNMDNKEQISLFEKGKCKNSVHIMISVNMYNEGLHLNGVNRVILLRKTKSPIIYFQQIGRALTTNSNETPIVFDLVNNAENIEIIVTKNKIEEAIVSEDTERGKIGLRRKSKFNNVIVHDETKPIENVLKDITERLTGWIAHLVALSAFRQTRGHFNVPESYKTDNGMELGKWVSNVRMENDNGLLSREKKNSLNVIKFSWTKESAEFMEAMATETNPSLFGTYFNLHNNQVCEQHDRNGFIQLDLFVSKYGSIRELFHNKKNNKELYIWLRNVKLKYENFELNDFVADQFISRGIHLNLFNPSLSKYKDLNYRRTPHKRTTTTHSNLLSLKYLE